MTIYCAPPDPSLGVALRLSHFLDCEARALGENGFQALAGGPVGMGLLSGLVTIFVALIGYRLLLGEAPGFRDGIGWAARLGIVLALVTSWPAFQTLVYRVAVDGPAEVANILLPASGLPSEGVEGRVQLAYDTIRLGTTGPTPPSSESVTQGSDAAAQAAFAQRFQFQPPLPRTASLFVITTTGFLGALRIAIGFLLAVGPIPLMALLFAGTGGLFVGWVRALAGAALASLAVLIVTSLDLVVVESELARLQAFRGGGSAQTLDPQALTTIVVLFALVMLVVLAAATRMASAYRLPAASPFHARAERPSVQSYAQRPNLPVLSAEATILPASNASQARVAVVAEALNASANREQRLARDVLDASGPRTDVLVSGASTRRTHDQGARPLGLSGRRGIGRRTRQAARRDMIR